MTIDKHCDQDSSFPGSQAEAHALIALEQSALYAARLVIARWINNSAQAPAPDAAARTTWYLEAQQNFQEWLGCGGFAQYEIPRAEQCAPVVAGFSAPSAANPVTGSGPNTADSCVD